MGLLIFGDGRALSRSSWVGLELEAFIASCPAPTPRPALGKRAGLSPEFTRGQAGSATGALRTRSVKCLPRPVILWNATYKKSANTIATAVMPIWASRTNCCFALVRNGSRMIVRVFVQKSNLWDDVSAGDYTETSRAAKCRSKDEMRRYYPAIERQKTASVSVRQAASRKMRHRNRARIH